jgi:hypothetical protein
MEDFDLPSKLAKLQAQAARPQVPEPIRRSPRKSLVMVRASDITPQKIKWLWRDRFALGKFSLIAGNPGLGKWQLSLHMAAMVTTGTIGHDGDPCGRCAEQLLGGVGTKQPAVRFLLFDRQLTIVGGLSFLAPPNLRMDEAQARAIVRIHAQDRMQKQPNIGAIADGPEIVLAVGLRLIIDLGRILDRQNVTTAHQAGGSLADGLNDFGHLYPNIIQKSPELSLAGATVSEFTHPQCLTFYNSLDEGCAPFSRHASPKYPNPSGAIVHSLESRWQKENHTRFPPTNDFRSSAVEFLLQTWHAPLH